MKRFWLGFLCGCLLFCSVLGASDSSQKWRQKTDLHIAGLRVAVEQLRQYDSEQKEAIQKAKHDIASVEHNTKLLNDWAHELVKWLNITRR